MVLALIYSHRFSTGFNSGEYGGKNNNVILPGITRSLDRCQPAPSNTSNIGLLANDNANSLKNTFMQSVSTFGSIRLQLLPVVLETAE